MVTAKLMTMAVRIKASRQRVGELAAGAAPDERRQTGAPRGQEQDVPGVREDPEPDHDPAELSLEHEIAADADQERGGRRERRRSRSSVSRLVTERFEHHEDEADHQHETPMSKNERRRRLHVADGGDVDDDHGRLERLVTDDERRCRSHAAINRPAPRIVQGRTLVRLRTSAIPPARYRRVIAVPTTRPPTKPPPGWLCPANRSHTDTDQHRVEDHLRGELEDDAAAVHGTGSRSGAAAHPRRDRTDAVGAGPPVPAPPTRWPQWRAP